MTEVVGEAVVELRADDRRLASDISRSGSSAGRSFGSTFLRGAAVIGGGLAALGVGSFVKSAITSASDLNETINKTKVIFGAAAPAILDFSKDANTALGQTRQQALDAAATFGIFGKSAGLRGVELSRFSGSLTSLTADLASFNNTSPEEAIEAVGAALRGESEPIRKYGVLLDDASLRQEALRQGLVKTTKEALTPQQRVLAAQALIFKQTRDAQGDFARTSDGLANQQRILSASLHDTAGAAGQALLPAVTAVVSGLAGFVAGIREGTGAGGQLREIVLNVASAVIEFVRGALPGIIAFGRNLVTTFGPLVTGALKQLPGIFNAILSAVHALAPAILALSGFFADHATIVQAIAVAVLAAVAAFKVWQLTIAIVAAVTKAYAAVQAILNAVLAANPIGLVVLALIALAAGLVFAYKHSQTFRDIVNGAFHAVQAVVGSVVNFITGAVTGAIDFVRSHWKLMAAILAGPIGVAVFLIAKNWDKIKAVFSAAINAVKGVATAGFNAVKTGISNAMNAAKTVVSNVWNGIKSTIQDKVSEIVGVVTGLAGKVAGLAGKFLNAGTDLGGKIIDGLKAGLSAVGGVATDFATAIKDAINDLLNLPFTIHGPGPLPDFTIPAFASGVHGFEGGLALVGENGPEVALLPPGTDVLNAPTTRRLRAMAAHDGLSPTATAAGRPIEIHAHLPTGDPEAAALAVWNRLVTATPM